MALTVILDPEAYDDTLRITGFISRRVSPVSAARWKNQIESAIALLESEASQWAEAEEAANVGIVLRVLLHGRGRHVYRIL